MQPDAPTHGGRRTGAGRKPKDVIADARRYHVMLDPGTVRGARQLAQGDLSAGLRKAVRMAKEIEGEK